MIPGRGRSDTREGVEGSQGGGGGILGREGGREGGREETEWGWPGREGGR